ncbi:MAG: transcription termination factor NusA, partial [Planctomycetota bacterium]
ALVLVDEDQLSLAIGRKGQNVRLASKLAGWEIDIMTRAELEQSVADDDRAAEAETVEADPTDSKTTEDEPAESGPVEAKTAAAETAATETTASETADPEIPEVDTGGAAAKEAVSSGDTVSSTEIDSTKQSES